VRNQFLKFCGLRLAFMSLYRKYRPQTFEDVVGQEHVAQTLRNALSSDPIRVAHAYLFCGPRGTGKTTTARLLAKCLNCEQGPTATPCNQCDFCLGVTRNATLMDLIEVDGASNRKIDDARELIANIGSAPSTGRYRVYIIDEVHMLTNEAFNALLKTLEEPPPHAVFVLATTDAHKLPTTVTSRCQRYDFRRLGPRDIAARLQWVSEKESIALEENAARLIALTADGALRDALTLLEQVAAFSPEAISEADVRLVLGTVSRELLEEIIAAVAAGDAVRVLRALNGATEEGASFAQLTRDLINYTRDLLLLTVGYESEGVLSGEEMQVRRHYAEALGRARLMSCVEALRAADKEMRQSTDHRLLLELTLVRAASGETASGPMPSTLASSTPAPSTPVAPQPVWRQPAVSAPPAPSQNGHAPQPETSAAPPLAETPPAETPPAETPPAETPPAEVPADETSLDETSADEVPPDAAEETPAGAVKPAPKPKKKGRRIHNLEEFIELWPGVLVRVKKKIGITAVAYLHDAYPVALTDEEAVLEFKKEFHYAKACEAAERHPFEEVLNSCMDAPRRLKFQLAPPAPKPAPVAEPVARYDDEDEEEDILSVAKDMFGAEVVGRSGRG
jgi:DNA polymerase-3 subunit gamma/tau